MQHLMELSFRYNNTPRLVTVLRLLRVGGVPTYEVRFEDGNEYHIQYLDGRWRSRATNAIEQGIVDAIGHQILGAKKVAAEVHHGLESLVDGPNSGYEHPWPVPPVL